MRGTRKGARHTDDVYATQGTVTIGWREVTTRWVCGNGSTRDQLRVGPAQTRKSKLHRAARDLGGVEGRLGFGWSGGAEDALEDGIYGAELALQVEGVFESFRV